MLFVKICWYNLKFLCNEFANFEFYHRYFICWNKNEHMTHSKRNKTEPVYTLSVAAGLSGAPQHSVRQYVDKGLIIPFKKKSNRHLFSDVDIERLMWIKRNLEEKGMSFAGIKSLMALIPCWKITNCQIESRKNCEAYFSSDFPCWEASDKGKECKNKDCRVCKVYKLVDSNLELKSVYRELLP